MTTDLDDLMRKTKTYWYEDGLVETLAGLFFVAALGLSLLWLGRRPTRAPTFRWPSSCWAPGWSWCR